MNTQQKYIDKKLVEPIADGDNIKQDIELFMWHTISQTRYIFPAKIVLVSGSKVMGKGQGLCQFGAHSKNRRK